MAISDRIISWHAGSSTADSHGSHTLTANGTSPTYVAGKIGNAFDCDTTNTTYWSIANVDAADYQFGLASKSVAFWVYPNTLPTSGNGASLVRMGSSSAADVGFHVIYNNNAGTGQFIARMASGTVLYTATASGYAVGAWYHVAAVYDRKGLLRLYVNGVMQASVSIAAASAVDMSSDDELRIGGSHQVYFDGLMDEVMFYDGCLSGDLMGRHSNGTTGRSYADFIDSTAPYVSQEFLTISTTNVDTAVSGVSDLVAGERVMVIQQVDGNSTSPSITAWDGAWTQIVDAVATQTGTAWTRQRVWWKTVTATDVSTETQVETLWTNGQEVVQRVLMWGNSAGVLVYGTEAGTTNTTSRTSPSIDTTGTDGCRILVIHGWDAPVTLTSTDAALVNGLEISRNTSGGVQTWTGYELQVTGGATGTYPFTLGSAFSAIGSTIAMEPASAGATVPASAADGAVLGDTPANTLTKIASALDGVVLSDVPAVAAALQRAVDDGLSLSDVATAIISIGGAATDGLAFGDSLVVSLVRYASVIDGIVFTDTAVFPTGAAYAAATVTLAAAIAANVTIQAAISAAVTIKPD